MKKGAIGKIYDIKVYEILIILGGVRFFYSFTETKFYYPLNYCLNNP